MFFRAQAQRMRPFSIEVTYAAVLVRCQQESTDP